MRDAGAYALDFFVLKENFFEKLISFGERDSLILFLVVLLFVGLRIAGVEVPKAFDVGYQSHESSVCGCLFD